MVEKRWKILTADKDKVETLHHSLTVNRILCSILIQRGIDTFDKAKQFFCYNFILSSAPCTNTTGRGK